MSKLYSIAIALLTTLFACSQAEQEDSLLSFGEAAIHHEHVSTNNYKNGWYAPAGNVLIDTLTLYMNKRSLSLSPFVGDTIKTSNAYYCVDAREIDGDSIVFSGKYKYKYTATDTATITFSIRQFMRDRDMVESLNKVVVTSRSNGWSDFTVTAGMDKAVRMLTFTVLSVGEVQLWMSSCKVEIDKRPLGKMVHIHYEAVDDHEFDGGSRIALDPLSIQMAENLEVLGKVWGFLKYYHPEVAKGKYNWDYELFRVLSPIANARDKTARSKLLNQWIDKLGKIKETCDYTIHDPDQYSRITDLYWIKDEDAFGAELVAKLNVVKNARRSSKFNYYVMPFMETIDHSFDRERSYGGITWEDQGFRILTLFRLWNAIAYCFPYAEMTDQPWGGLLRKYIPRFTEAANSSSYELALYELGACVNDSHGYFIGLKSNMKGTSLEQRFYRNVVPVSLMEAKRGEIVVAETQLVELERGDVIRSIDGEEVSEIINRLSPYFAASNRPALLSRILPFLLRTNNDSLSVKYIRNGKERQLTLRNFKRYEQRGASKKNAMKTWQDYKQTAKGIVYLTLSDTVSKEAISGARGLIIDLRCYDLRLYRSMNKFITYSPQEFMWFSENDRSSPGNYKYASCGKVGEDYPDYFKGKVAILVSEKTQSHAECCAMAFRMAPQSAVIGSTTSGADGNIGMLNLPGNGRFTYTALGAYYPGWKICQRKGVDIDREVRPTVEEIRNRQDVWIENAVAYILE